MASGVETRNTLTVLNRRAALVPVAIVVFGLNTAYLAAVANASAFYFTNVVLHMVLGLVLAVGLGRRLGGAWRSTGWFLRVTSGFCAAGALTGVAIILSLSFTLSLAIAFTVRMFLRAAEVTR